jgi:glycosyltransferase involved in cell wall biosynthesis
MQTLLFYFDADCGGTRGGSEYVLKQIYRYYAAQGNTIYVIFHKEKEFGGWDTILDKNTHLLYGGGLKRIISNLWHLHKIRFDLSYSTFANYTGLLGLLKRIGILKINRLIGRESTPIFDRYHGINLRLRKLVYQLGYPAVDTVICQTDYMRNRLTTNLPWITNKAKVIVVPNPMDLDQASIQSSELDVEINKFCPYIITAGRFIKEKAYDVLLPSFKKLLEDYPQLSLLILGDGPLKDQVVKQIEELDLQKKVVLYGFADNVFPFFKNAQLCVISSRIEGFPNVLLQMMSQNDKVVSSLCADGIDRIDGLYTCQPDDVMGLYEAMKHCLQERTDACRSKFDVELHRRSINNFMKIIEDSFIN